MKQSDIFILEERDLAEKMLSSKLNEFVDTNGRYSRSGRNHDLDAPEEDDDKQLFSGDIYKNKSKIKKRKKSLFSRKRRVRGTAGSVAAKKFEPIFILGYQIKQKNVFYEIWYDPFIGKYQIFDKFGYEVEDEQDSLNAIVNILIKVVESYDARKEREKVRRASRDSIRRKGYRIDDFDYDRFMESDETEIENAINEAIDTKRMLANALNDQVEEYKTTKMDKYRLGWLMRRVIGKPIKTPKDFDYSPLGKRLKRPIDRFIGREKEATFIAGYSLANKVDYEIWHVKEAKYQRSSFYVFDMTSGELVESQLKTMKQAAKVISDRMKIDV